MLLGSFKTVEGFGFFLVDVKNGQELRNRQQILKFLSQVEKFQLSCLRCDSFVEIDHRDVEPPRNLTRDSRLAASHEAGDDDWLHCYLSASE